MDRKAYQKKLDAQMKEWSAQISLFQARADKAGAEARVEYYKMIDSLQKRQNEIGAKLQELKAASDQAWDGLKVNTEKAWSEFKTILDNVSAKFK